MKINEVMIKEVYLLGKKILNGEIDKAEAVKNLVEKTGMNRNSARKYIACIDALLRNGDYGSTVKEYAIEYFLISIMDDFGEYNLTVALQVLERHLKYQEGKNNLPGMWEIYNRYYKLIKKGD